MLGAGVADALSLAALREHLLRREFEALVQDGLAKRQRGRRALAQFGRPGAHRPEGSAPAMRSVIPSASASSGSTVRPVKISSFARQADPAGQEVHAAAVRDQPAQDKAPREAGRVRGNDEVAAQRGVDAEARGRPLTAAMVGLGSACSSDHVVHSLLAAPAVKPLACGRPPALLATSPPARSPGRPGQHQRPIALSAATCSSAGHQVAAHVVVIALRFPGGSN